MGAASFLWARVAAAFLVAALRARGGAGLRAAARCLRVAAAFLPAARCLRAKADFSAAARRFAALRFRVAAAFCPAVLRTGLMFPPASSCGNALNLKFIRHASMTIYAAGVNRFG